MQIINLYKYKREDGGINVSPNKPNEKIRYTQMYRIIAEDGMELVKDTNRVYCSDIEIEDLPNWHEEAKQKGDE